MPRAKDHKLPPLLFDSSGSATARFFGEPFEVGIHYVNCATSMLKMICPGSLEQADAKQCPMCLQKPASKRIVSIVWDVRTEKWCLYIAPSSVFADIFEKCKKEAVTKEQMAAGTGPDVLIQRIGKMTDVFVMPETIGQARGKPVTYHEESDWALKTKNKDSGYVPYPSVPKILRGLYNNSIWRSCGNEEEAIRAYPKSRDEEQAYAPPTPIVAPRAPRVFLNLEERLSRISDIPARPAPQEGPIKAVPKMPPKSPPKMPDVAQDRWDMI